MKNLSNAQLEISLKKLIASEQRIDKEIILHLEEMERRRLFLEKDCSSMFVYCTQILAMTESQTQRRLLAMRMVKNDDVLKIQMNEDNLSISQLSLMGNIQGKLVKEGITKAEIKKIIHKNIENFKDKSVHETEKILHQEFNIKKKKKIILEVDDETYELWIKFRLKNAKKSDTDLIQEIIIPQEKVLTLKKENQKGRIPTPALKEAVLKKANYQCVYINPKTGRRCESRHNLNIDHMIGWKSGGETTLSNLQCLCFHHNQQKEKIVSSHLGKTSDGPDIK